MRYRPYTGLPLLRPFSVVSAPRARSPQSCLDWEHDRSHRVSVDIVDQPDGEQCTDEPAMSRNALLAPIMRCPATTRS
jgi:hypothetical protein